MVDLAGRLLALGVKRVEYGDLTLEFADIAISRAVTPDATAPEEAGELEKLEEHKAEQEREARIYAELASAG